MRTYQCTTCRHCVPQAYNIAGKVDTELVCLRNLAAFPKGWNCKDYERAPGSDDS